ncbi:MAG: acylphosphatase [bacterium]|nr:acylphosphatase [bacterium]
MKRVHIFFSGYVQGVGFRYTARRVAQTLGAVGWVKNCYDGRVELVAEGEEPMLQQLLTDLDRAFEGYITNSDVTWEEGTGEFSSFTIRF